MAKRRMKRKNQTNVSDKISLLRKEGRSQDQAVAIALNTVGTNRRKKRKEKRR